MNRWLSRQRVNNLITPTRPIPPISLSNYIFSSDASYNSTLPMPPRSKLPKFSFSEPVRAKKKKTASHHLHSAVSNAGKAKQTQSTSFVDEAAARSAQPATLSTTVLDADTPLPEVDEATLYHITENDDRRASKRRRGGRRATKLKRVCAHCLISLLFPPFHTTFLYGFLLVLFEVDLLAEWIRKRDIFMDEMLRREGLAGQEKDSKCSRCNEADGILRCKDCTGSLLMCAGCMCETHAAEPLHRIEVRFFSFNHVSLKPELTLARSNGQGVTFPDTACAKLVSSCSSAMTAKLVRTHTSLSLSLSSILQVFIWFRLGSAIAEILGRHTTMSRCFAQTGGPRHSGIREPGSRFGY